jgi:hypothetical protein
MVPAGRKVRYDRGDNVAFPAAGAEPEASPPKKYVKTTTK